MSSREVLDRELAHHEEFYSGRAQQVFSQPAVRGFRRHLVDRIVRRLNLTAQSRVLSLGSGTGDTEILLAGHVSRVLGLDLSPAGVGQASEDAARAGATNAEFRVASIDTVDLAGERFDAIVAVFFLHHLDDGELEKVAARLPPWLLNGGRFYALDPSRRRLSGALGQLLVPGVMARYQSPDERPLLAGEVAASFGSAGFRTETALYDFASFPVAGLFPGWGAGYRMARTLDDLLLRIPGIRELGSNFELVAYR